MQTLDGISNRLTLTLVFFLTALTISSCDDTPVVRGDLSPDDAEVNADTVYLSDISQVRSPSFSGNLPFITSGMVDDPVFGKTDATALIRPSIERDEDENEPGEQVFLALQIEGIHGMEADPAEFHVIEVDRRWRSSSWRYDSIPDLTDNIVADFTVTGPDSITILLDPEWGDTYRNIYETESDSIRESLYDRNLPGLAIVPADNHGKMIILDARSSAFVFRQDDGSGDLQKELNSWAVSIDNELTEEEDAYGNSKPVDNTFASFLELDIAFTEEFLGTSNFSRVELVLYEDTTRVQQNTPSEFIRPKSETMRLYRLQPDQLNYAITADPFLQVNRRDEDGSYRINLTGLANTMLHNGTDDRTMYATLGFNDGRFMPALIAGTGHAERQPKLLITSISKKQ